jgi:hypothetical protein
MWMSGSTGGAKAGASTGRNWKGGGAACAQEWLDREIKAELL